MGRKKSPNEIMDRASFQGKENYPTIETGLPKDRFQTDAQIASATNTVTKAKTFASDGNSNNTGSDSLVARTATAVKKKVSIKPTSDTALEEGKSVGGVPLGDSAAIMSVAGAQPIGISSDQSRVPYTRGGARSNERYGKKIATDNFVINNVVSEQIKPSFDEPKDIREAPDALQGYNGRKQFTTARGKKIFGSHPSATLYERSVDFEGHSAVVSTSGQVTGSINASSGYPILPEDGGYSVECHKGNFLITGFNINITDGHISGLSFDETEIVVPDGAEAIDQVNMNWQVDANNVAKAMIKMQTELGRETTDKWSPLGYVIDQPYQFGMLFHDGEATLGALTGAAYKSAAHSLAFYQNRMAKEGVRNLASVAEWLGEDIATAANPEYYDADTNIFDRAKYRQGSAAALIAMFDSPNKYTTKADFINQPRSFKMHLQTVDNNINPFHGKAEFFKALDKAFLFSTEDGQYNPTLPVHVTDMVKVMTPYSLNTWLEGWTNPYLSTPLFQNGHGNVFSTTGIARSAVYRYNDLRNNYVWEYVDPFVAGLCRWLLRHEAALVKAYGETAQIHLPVHFTNTTANMFSFMVCSASQDMAWMRNIIFRDYLFAGEQGVYVWDDLASLSELNPLASTQYSYSDYGSALKLGAMSTASKIRLYWPEVITLRESAVSNDTVFDQAVTPVVGYYLPFYYNENAIDPNALSGISSDSGAVMSFPIMRNGVNHEFNDLLYSISERDIRLCLDRMVTVPVSVDYDADTHTAQGIHSANHYHYSALRYDDNSDGRVIMTMTDLDGDYGLRELTYLATPRELGFMFPLPMCFKKPFRTGSLTFEVTPVDIYITGAKPEYITSYYATGSIARGTYIDRAASLTQTWIRCFADPRRIAVNNAFVTTTAIVPTISCFVDATLAEQGQDIQTTYNLYHDDLFAVPAVYQLRSDALENVEDMETQDSAVGNNTVFSMAKFFWAMIQRLYSPINVFDSAWLDIADGGVALPVGDGVTTDPLEAGVYFGFAGCLGSDFNQDILERLTIKDELGMFYYKDEFIKSSLIFN